jgi:hypothetical protein
MPPNNTTGNTSNKAANATQRLYCGGITKQFMQALTHRYMVEFPDTNQITVQRNIKEWLTKGKESEFIDHLFTVDEQKHFPFWWAGFYVEDPNKTTNPVQNMKRAALLVNGYSSLNVPLSDEFKKQSVFWKACSEMNTFRWGEYLSSTYTKMALRHDPEHIGLFLNKDSAAFLTSFFFKTELKLINAHYKELGWPVYLHVFNLRQNCKEIKGIIDRVLMEANEEGKSYIKVICKPCRATRNRNGKTSTLKTCVRNRSTRSNRTNKGINVNIGNV